MKGPKILTVDIETLPITTYNWSLFDEPRALDRLVKDWAVYMAAAKWMHQRRVMIKDTEKESSPYNDKGVITWLCGLLDEADIVVGQNIRNFDLRKIRARAITHGLKPFREPQIVDTLTIGREVAKFTSHKLEHLSSNLTRTKKSKHKAFPGFEMWLEILNKNPKAYRESRNYNRDDVRSTEELYKVFRPWARKHPNLAHYYDDDKCRCPRCGSDKVRAEGLVHSGVSTYLSMKCNSCGGYSRTRFNKSSKAKRQGLLAVI